MFRDREDIVHQVDMENRAEQTHQHRVHHENTFRRFSKIAREPKDQPSYVRMSKSIDLPQA
jgi:hypothetical protein